MKASEARARAINSSVLELDDIYRSAIESIKEASDKGNFECWFFRTMSPDLRSRLQGDGYVVGDTLFGPYGPATEISWR